MHGFGVILLRDEGGYIYVIWMVSLNSLISCRHVQCHAYYQYYLNVVVILMQIRVPLKIAIKSKDVVVDIQKRVSTVDVTVSNLCAGLELF